VLGEPTNAVSLYAAPQIYERRALNFSAFNWRIRALCLLHSDIFSSITGTCLHRRPCTILWRRNHCRVRLSSPTRSYLQRPEGTNASVEKLGLSRAYHRSTRRCCATCGETLVNRRAGSDFAESLRRHVTRGTAVNMLWLIVALFCDNTKVVNFSRVFFFFFRMTGGNSVAF